MALSIPPTFDLLYILMLLAILFLMWIIVSIPVYIAAKIIKGGKVTFSQAMLATLLGPIVFIFVRIVATFFLGFLGVSQAALLALIIAFIFWLWVYKASFNTGWLQAFGIALLAILFLIILSFIIGIIIPITLLLIL
ncbi:MAG: hypothetical protein QXP55_05495 [Nitrososphaerales archaeon]